MDTAPAIQGASASYVGTTQLGAVWARFRKRRMGVIGLFVLGLLIAGVILVPAFSPFEATSIASDYNSWLTPMNPNPDLWHAPMGSVDSATGRTYWLGTDKLGRDVLTRLFLAGRVTLLVALVSAVVTTLLGVVVGAVAGFYGGWVDTLFMRLTDFALAWPVLPVYLLAIKFFRESIAELRNPRDLAGSVPLILLTVILPFVLFSWMGVARLIRGNILTLRSMAFIEATRALGAGNRRIIFKHLLPNSLAPILVAFTLIVGDFIIWEAVLAYFGQGIREPPAISWGNLLASAQSHIWFVTQPNPFEQIRFYLFLFPCVFILLTVLSINYIADALRSALDPTEV